MNCRDEEDMLRTTVIRKKPLEGKSRRLEALENCTANMLDRLMYCQAARRDATEFRRRLHTVVAVAADGSIGKNEAKGSSLLAAC